MNERYKLSEEEMKFIMTNLTDEERAHSMQLGLYWICSVIDKCNMNTQEANVQELLDILFEIKGHFMEE